MKTALLILSLLGTGPALRGPNCWNAALLSAGLVNGVHHVGADEFTFYLEGPLCHEVPFDQSLPGDIVAFRRATRDGRLVNGPYGYEIHGFTLAGGGMAFTKNGTATGDRYQIQSLESLRQDYEKTNRRECRQLGLPAEACHLKIQTFRCGPGPAEIPVPLREIEEGILALERDLHEFYTKGADAASLPARKTAFFERIDRLRVQTGEIEARLPSAEASRLQWHFERALHRLDSFRIWNN